MLHRTNSKILKNLAGNIFSVIFPVFSVIPVISFRSNYLLNFDPWPFK